MKQYLDLVRDVLANGRPDTGTFRGDRTGVGTYSVFGRQLRFNLEDGFQEWQLRLPSIFFTLLAAFFVYRLARELCNPGTALLSLFFFLWQVDLVRIGAGLARPYGLGILGASASTYFLLRWLKKPGRAALAGYVLFSLVLVYSKLLFGGLFFVHALALGLYRKEVSRATAAQKVGLAAAFGLVLACCCPVLLVAGELVRVDPAGFDMGLPPAEEIIDFVLTPELLCLGCLVFVGFLIGRRFGAVWTKPREWVWDRGASLVLAWHVAPALLLWSVSALRNFSVFQGRYLLWGLPGSALLAAMLLDRFFQPRFKLLFLTAMQVLILAHFSKQPWVIRQDLREAAALTALQAAAQHSRIVLKAPLIEGRSLKWLNSEDRNDYLTAPITVYEPELTVTAVPWELNNEESRHYIAQRLELGTANPKITFLYMEEQDQPAVQRFMQAYGYRLAGLVPFTGMQVALFEQYRTTVAP